MKAIHPVNTRRRRLIENLADKAPDSYRLHREAIKHFAGGAVGARPPGNPWPIYTDHMEGPYAYDTDGNQYIDCTMAYGSVLLGHNHPAICEAVIKQAQKGLMHLGAGATQLQIEVAEKLKKLLPVNERFVFCNSGTEAMHKSITLARAFTGKDRIIKFSGHYHGTYEHSILSVRPTPFQTLPIPPDPYAAGISRRAIAETIVLPMNHPDSLSIIEDQAGDIAAVILEPVTSYGLLCFEKNYMQSLSALCRQHNILLVYDEIITGLRLGPDFCIKLYGVTPDIIAYGKALGGGMPIGMLATRKDIIDPCIKMKPALRMGGTFSGNPMTMAATNALLGYLLAHPETIQTTEKCVSDITTRIQHYLLEKRYPLHVRRIASLFVFHSLPTDPEQMEDMLGNDMKRLDELDIRSRLEGVVLSSFGANVLSIAHTAPVLDELETRFQRILDGLFSEEP